MSSPESRDAGTFGALVGLSVVSLGLCSLLLVIFPYLFWFVVFVGCFVFFGAFHYLVWGWWLKNALTEHPVDPPEEGADDQR